MEIVPDPRQQVSPCPYCFQIFAKDNQCNHVTCQKCSQKWKFLSGKNEPTSGEWMYDRGPRTYKIPGDINQKTGEIYQKYTDGVTPQMDLK